MPRYVRLALARPQIGRVLMLQKFRVVGVAIPGGSRQPGGWALWVRSKLRGLDISRSRTPLQLEGKPRDLYETSKHRRPRDHQDVQSPKARTRTEATNSCSPGPSGARCVVAATTARCLSLRAPDPPRSQPISAVTKCGSNRLSEGRLEHWNRGQSTRASRPCQRRAPRYCEWLYVYRRTSD